MYSKGPYRELAAKRLLAQRFCASMSRSCRLIPPGVALKCGSVFGPPLSFGVVRLRVLAPGSQHVVLGVQSVLEPGSQTAAVESDSAGLPAAPAAADGSGQAGKRHRAQGHLYLKAGTKGFTFQISQVLVTLQIYST